MAMICHNCRDHIIADQWVSIICRTEPDQEEIVAWTVHVECVGREPVSLPNARTWKKHASLGQ